MTVRTCLERRKESSKEPLAQPLEDGAAFGDAAFGLAWFLAGICHLALDGGLPRPEGLVDFGAGGCRSPVRGLFGEFGVAGL